MSGLPHCIVRPYCDACQRDYDLRLLRYVQETFRRNILSSLTRAERIRRARAHFEFQDTLFRMPFVSVEVFVAAEVARLEVGESTPTRRQEIEVLRGILARHPRRNDPPAEAATRALCEEFEREADETVRAERA